MEIDFKEEDNSIYSFLNDWINKCNYSGNIKENCSWKFKDLDQDNPIVQAIRMILIKNNLNPDNIELLPQTVQENNGNLVFNASAKSTEGIDHIDINFDFNEYK